jgi:hypothetical protein
MKAKSIHGKSAAEILTALKKLFQIVSIPH